MLANVNLNNDLQILRPSVGRVIIVGNRGNIEINPRFMMGKETSIVGITLFGSTEVCLHEVALKVMICTDLRMNFK